MSNPNIEPVEVALLQRNASLPEPEGVLSRFVEFYAASLQREQEMLVKQEMASDLLAAEDALDDVADLASLAAAAEEEGLVPSEGDALAPVALEGLEGLADSAEPDAGGSDDPGAFFAELGAPDEDAAAEGSEASPDDFFAQMADEPVEDGAEAGGAPATDEDSGLGELAPADGDDVLAADGDVGAELGAAELDGFDGAGDPGPDLLGDEDAAPSVEPELDPSEEPAADEDVTFDIGFEGAQDDVAPVVTEAPVDEHEAVEAGAESPVEGEAFYDMPTPVPAVAEDGEGDAEASVAEEPAAEAAPDESAPKKKKSRKKSKKKKK